jgi:hypothetical protein
MFWLWHLLQTLSYGFFPGKLKVKSIRFLIVAELGCRFRSEFGGAQRYVLERSFTKKIRYRVSFQFHA